MIDVDKTILTTDDFLIASSGNQAPIDLALSSASTKSDATVGTVVGTITATDPDAGDTFTFSLPANAGGLFTVAAPAKVARRAQRRLL